MGKMKIAGKRVRHPGQTLLTAKDIDGLRLSVLPGGHLHGKPLWNVGRTLEVGGGDARRAIEGTGEYEDAPGTKVPPVQLAPGVLAILAAEVNGSSNGKVVNEEEVQNMERKPRKYPTHQEAVLIREEYYKKHIPPLDIMARHFISRSLLSEIVSAQGKWSYFIDQDQAQLVGGAASFQPTQPTQPAPEVKLPVAVASDPPKFAFSSPAHVGNFGIAMETAGLVVGPVNGSALGQERKSAPTQSPVAMPGAEPLLVNQLNWKWGRDKQNPLLAHCWREKEDAMGKRRVVSLCGRIIPINETSRLVNEKSDPSCQHCVASFTIITTGERERGSTRTQTQPQPQPSISAPAPVPTPEAATLAETTTGATTGASASGKSEPKQTIRPKGFGKEVGALLLDILKDGPVRSDVVFQQAMEKLGASEAFVRKIKGGLGIKHKYYKQEGAGPKTFPDRRRQYTMWSLPNAKTMQPKPTPAPAPAPTPTLAPKPTLTAPLHLVSAPAPTPVSISTQETEGGVLQSNPPMVSQMVKEMFDLVLRATGGDLREFGYIKGPVDMDKEKELQAKLGEVNSAVDLLMDSMAQFAMIARELVGGD